MDIIINMNFTEAELNTPINEFESEALEYISTQVEADSPLHLIDVTYLDEDEIARLVRENMDLIDY